MVGTRGAASRSPTSCRTPVTALAPPESMAAFQATGDSSGLFDGAAACTRLPTRKPIRSLSRQSSSASTTRSSAARPVAR